jgi:hypothetical protein
MKERKKTERSWRKSREKERTVTRKVGKVVGGD